MVWTCVPSVEMGLMGKAVVGKEQRRHIVLSAWNKRRRQRVKKQAGATDYHRHTQVNALVVQGSIQYLQSAGVRSGTKRTW